MKIKIKVKDLRSADFEMDFEFSSDKKWGDAQKDIQKQCVFLDTQGIKFSIFLQNEGGFTPIFADDSTSMSDIAEMVKAQRAATALPLNNNVENLTLHLNISYQVAKKFYPYVAVDTPGRSHKWAAELTGYDEKGDALKTRLLMELWEQLDGPQTRAELTNRYSELKDTPKYKALNKGQDRWTRFWSAETDSSKAFRKIYENLIKNLPQETAHDTSGVQEHAFKAFKNLIKR